MTSEFTIAVHALVYLNHKQAVLSSEELAANICTNPARVRKVMSKLKKAGLIVTKEGQKGGYSFVLDPEQVTLCQVGEAVSAKMVASSWNSGSMDMDCLVASGMSGVMEGIFEELNAVCMKELEQITVERIDQQIFAKK